VAVPHAIQRLLRHRYGACYARPPGVTLASHSESRGKPAPWPAPTLARRLLYHPADEHGDGWHPPPVRNGREHVWLAGRWELGRDGYAYVGPQWVFRFGRWEYLPGHWVRRVYA
jgi:hypothetical protein